MTKPAGFFSKLFDTSDFPARWHCGNWSETHGWIHVVSDLATFGAYMAIPAVLGYFVMRRRDVVFPRVFWLFCIFIASCGTVHLIDATIFWHPWYRFSGAVKLVTAVASWATVVALIRITPLALKLPSLAAVNLRLEDEVAERRRASIELQRTNHDLTQFAHVASHDLRSPLRAIGNLSSWIREDAGGTLPPKCEEHMAELESRVGLMTKLLDDLLEYSRAGRVHGELAPVDVGELAARIWKVLDVPEGFRLVVEPGIPSITTLETPLEICLRNLISNAIQHHDREQGTIVIGATEQVDTLEISVRDDGPGISPDHHERIFNAFQRLPSRGARDGHGLGLAIIRRLVILYGGAVSVDSAPGRGSTFLLRWPLQIQLDDLHTTADPADSSALRELAS